jgi:alpha-ketoglutarate-dependent taurine dioxygenase
LSDYLRYAFEWVYTYSSKAGQEIRILDLDEQPAAAVLQRTGDFWVVEHQHVALVRYDDQYRHQGEVAVEDTSAAGYVAVAELAWHLGVPFADWWAAHPQYRRAGQAA